jgi:hypothetical protein
LPGLIIIAQPIVPCLAHIHCAATHKNPNPIIKIRILNGIQFVAKMSQTGKRV